MINLKSQEEQVLVIPRNIFTQLGEFQGLNTNINHYIPTFLDPKNTSFLPRSIAEKDPNFKQIIPYIIFSYQDKFLRYFRGKGTGESRLHQKGSIGIGGHINLSDVISATVDYNIYECAVLREVTEELLGVSNYHEEIIAILNDDSNDVGKVHLGIIHHFKLENNAITARELEICNLEFISFKQLEQEKESLESWSQILVNYLALKDEACFVRNNVRVD